MRLLLYLLEKRGTKRMSGQHHQDGLTKMAADNGLLRDRVAAATVIMYGSYMVLFLRFFITKYLTPVPQKKLDSKPTEDKIKETKRK